MLRRLKMGPRTTSIHLAGFPKDLPPDLRQATAVHIARSYDSDIQIPATGQKTQEEKQ